MGFFDIFRKKELENVKFGEIDAWLDDFLKKKGLDKKMEALNEQTVIKISEIKAALENLEKAELLNEKIPERAKQIMEGNRKTYIRRIGYFLDNFALPENVLAISDFSKRLSEDLDELGKDTHKNYYVLKEFLEHDAYAVAKRIKELETLMQNTSQELEKENIHSAQSVKKKLKQYEKDLESLEYMEKEKKEEAARLEELRLKQEKVKKKLKELKESKDLERFNKLKERQEQNLEDIKKEENQFFQLFSQLERPLRKYKRGSLEEDLINRYLDNHMGALKGDEEMKILEILDKLKQNVKGLELKEKQEAKIAETIERLNKDFLLERKAALERLEQEKKEIHHLMNQNVIMLNMMEQESFLDNNQTLMEMHQRKLDELDNKISKIQPQEVRKEIKEALKEIVNVTL